MIYYSKILDMDFETSKPNRKINGGFNMTGFIVLLCVLNFIVLPLIIKNDNYKKYSKWITRLIILLCIINLISHLNILNILFIIIILYVLIGRDKTFYGRK